MAVTNSLKCIPVLCSRVRGLYLGSASVLQGPCLLSEPTPSEANAREESGTRFGDGTRNAALTCPTDVSVVDHRGRDQPAGREAWKDENLEAASPGQRRPLARGEPWDPPSTMSAIWIDSCMEGLEIFDQRTASP